MLKELSKKLIIQKKLLLEKLISNKLSGLLNQKKINKMISKIVMINHKIKVTKEKVIQRKILTATEESGQ